MRPLTRHAFGQQPQQILQGINWVNDGAKCLCGSYRARDVCSGLVQDVTDATRTGPVRTGQAMDQDISRLRGIVYEIKKWNEEIVGLALAHASAVVPVLFLYKMLLLVQLAEHSVFFLRTDRTGYLNLL